MSGPYIYSAVIDALAFTTATDIFECTVTSDAPVLFHALELCQTTDLQDANEEVLRIGYYTGATAGSTGTALTETNYNRVDLPTLSLAVVANRGTPSSGGTLRAVHGWNIRVPFEKIWTPEMRPRVDSGEDVVTFKLLSAPTDSITISGTLYWEEL